MKNKKHISKPNKSPLAHNDMYHVSVSEKEINLGDTYNEKKVEHAEFSRWSGDQICWFIIGIILSSVSAIAHHRDELTILANRLSWDAVDAMLALFPRFAEDAGLSIILALLAIVAGLSVGIAVEDLSKSHMFRFRYMSKMLMRLCGLSVCFLGLSSASLLLRYGKGLGTLLILVLLFWFTMFYGIGDISANYGSRLRLLSSSLKNAERELNSIVSTKRRHIVFSSIKWWNMVLGGIGSLIDIIVCAGISIYHPEQLSFYLIITLMIIFYYCVMIYCLGAVLYDSISIFNGSFRGKLILKILFLILLVVFSLAAAFCFSMIFILTPNGYTSFVIIFVFSFIILNAICIPLFLTQNKQFLFVETRIARLKNKIDLTRRLIDLIKTEE